MSTNINPEPMAPAAPKKNTRWAGALDSVDKRRSIAWFGRHFDSKGNPSVLLAREFDPQHERAIWVKQYIANDDNDLRAFNQHERDILDLLKDVVHCYHMTSSSETSVSYLAKMIGAGRHVERGQAILKTTDKGSSVEQWLQWPVEANGERLDHVFQLPGHYLRFARAALVALGEVHDTGVVHCDLNPGNWCLETRFALLSDGQDRLRLTPEWDKVNIIDVGYSLHPARQTKTLLPFDTGKTSRYLNEAFVRAEAAGKRGFATVPDRVKRTKGWHQFVDAKFASDFWTSYAPYGLTAFNTVDWREDYWKLGQVLKQLRSPVHVSRIKDVNQLIGTADPGHEGLAESLMAWGTRDVNYHSTADPETRLQQARVLCQATHAALMQSLDAAIAQLSAQDEAQNVFLWRRDIDPDYLARIDADQARQARRRKHTQLAVGGSVVAVSLAGVLSAGHYGIEKLAKPTWAAWQADQQARQEQQRQEALRQAEQREAQRVTQATAPLAKPSPATPTPTPPPAVTVAVTPADSVSPSGICGQCATALVFIPLLGTKWAVLNGSNVSADVGRSGNDVYAANSAGPIAQQSPISDSKTGAGMDSYVQNAQKNPRREWLLVVIDPASGQVSAHYSGKRTLSVWSNTDKNPSRISVRITIPTPTDTDHLAREATAQAQANTQHMQIAKSAVSPPAEGAGQPQPKPTQQIQTVLRAGNATDIGGPTWQKAVEELVALCRNANHSKETAACKDAWGGVQQSYLIRSAQAKDSKNTWWAGGYQNSEPPKAMREWLMATRTLAKHGLWVAQVDQMMGDTVGIMRKVNSTPVTLASRTDAAQKLARLVSKPAPQAQATSFEVDVPLPAQRDIRIEGAQTLWVLAQKGQEGQANTPITLEARAIVPVELVLPALQAVANMPSQQLQALTGYSLACWQNQPAQAQIWFAKASVPEEAGNPEVIALASNAQQRLDRLKKGSSICPAKPQNG
ncbi:MAG: hypothetical protein H7293_02790 [Candidatus Saccharibacteria bacterium]|nr:hypothetical protein [Rhodoferax sp.]